MPQRDERNCSVIPTAQDGKILKSNVEAAVQAAAYMSAGVPRLASLLPVFLYASRSSGNKWMPAVVR